MTCDNFRARFAPSTDDAALLDHLRSCDACLNFAVEEDGDVLFRSLGGGELEPPGGVDAFVDDVMREVRLRGTESTMAPRAVSWPRRLSVAAALTAAVAGGTFMLEHRSAPAAAPPAIAHHQILKPVVKPIIESYDSQKATIVEVPTEGEDVKVVMVFDDSLPADL